MSFFLIWRRCRRSSMTDADGMTTAAGLFTKCLWIPGKGGARWARPPWGLTCRALQQSIRSSPDAADPSFPDFWLWQIILWFGLQKSKLQTTDRCKIFGMAGDRKCCSCHFEGSELLGSNTQKSIQGFISRTALCHTSKYFAGPTVRSGTSFQSVLSLCV